MEVGSAPNEAAQMGSLGERVVLSKDHPGRPALLKGRPEGVVSVRMGDWTVGWRLQNRCSTTCQRGVGV